MKQEVNSHLRGIVVMLLSAAAIYDGGGGDGVVVGVGGDMHFLVSCRGNKLHVIIIISIIMDLSSTCYRKRT